MSENLTRLSRVATRNSSLSNTNAFSCKENRSGRESNVSVCAFSIGKRQSRRVAALKRETLEMTVEERDIKVVLSGNEASFCKQSINLCIG